MLPEKLISNTTLENIEKNKKEVESLTEKIKSNSQETDIDKLWLFIDMQKVALLQTQNSLNMYRDMVLAFLKKAEEDAA